MPMTTPKVGVPQAVARAILPDRVRHRLGLQVHTSSVRVATTATRRLVSFVHGLVRVLPIRTQANLRDRLAPTVQLDHPEFRILIHADSDIEFVMRAHSCRKEPETVDWISTFIQAGDVVYDIGANIGAYSLLIDRQYAGKCQVFAFEPGFANFAQLNRNIHLNRAAGIIPLNIALHDETAMGEFTYRELSTGSALHSLDASQALSAERVYTQPMPTFRLDDFAATFMLPPPNHIKLDVDGVELAILHGADRLISDPALRSVLVEICGTTVDDDPIATWLAEHGFRLHARHTHPAHLQDAANCIFVRK